MSFLISHKDFLISHVTQRATIFRAGAKLSKSCKSQSFLVAKHVLWGWWKRTKLLQKALHMIIVIMFLRSYFKSFYITTACINLKFSVLQNGAHIQLHWRYCEKVLDSSILFGNYTSFDLFVFLLIIFVIYNKNLSRTWWKKIMKNRSKNYPEHQNP